MTRILLMIGIFVGPLLFSQGTLAGEFEGLKVDRIPVAFVEQVKGAQGLETFYGDVISIADIKNRSAKDLAALLKEHQIETKKGDIFYPEEVEFLLKVKRAIGSNPGILKAPHTPD